MQTPHAIAIDVERPPGARGAASRLNEPVTLGVPLPRGFARLPGELAIYDSSGVRQSVQSAAVEHWNDGSIRWARVDFRATTGTSGRARYWLARADAATQPGAPAPAVSVHARHDAVLIDTGAALFTVREGGRFPIHRVVLPRHPEAGAYRCALDAYTTTARRCYVRLDRPRVECDGPLTAVISFDGVIRPPGNPLLLQLAARLHFFAGSRTVRIALTVRNPRQAGHRHGCWELGDPGSVFVRDLSIRVVLPPSAEPVVARCSTLPGEEPWELPASFELYQDSSGRDNWRSSNHVNRHGIVPLAFRGYRLRAPGRERYGTSATPVAVLSRGGHLAAIGMEYFWQNFPKALSAQEGELRLALFPGESGDVHEIQGGEQKTHVFFLAFGPDEVSGGAFDWWREPLVPHLAPETYSASRAVPHLVPTSEERQTSYDELVARAVEGDDAFEKKREVIDEYGWRHFGELYADHESPRDRPESRIVSHSNNEHDAIAGFALQFMRTADLRWWRLMNELAAHVADIDVYHTTRDRAAFNHGPFPPTAPYTDAGRSTHRSYPSGAGVPGGGPSAEHDYNRGLMLHYFLTGSELSRNAALELARFALDLAGDGRRTLPVARGGPTGRAAASGAEFREPNRASANCLDAVLVGYRLERDARFIAMAEQLIRRCVHPRDDVGSQGLADAERALACTMFLQALGRYLDDKIDSDDLDMMYAYGQEALLHYARWMAENEAFFLERRDAPREHSAAWAAHELRKSDVFAYAAMHAEGAERGRFRELSDSYFRHAIEMLPRTPGCTQTRPLVILMSCGLVGRYLDRHPDTAAPRPRWSGSFPPSERVVPRKTGAVRRAVAAGMGALSFLGRCGVAFVRAESRASTESGSDGLRRQVLLDQPAESMNDEAV